MHSSKYETWKEKNVWQNEPKKLVPNIPSTTFLTEWLVIHRCLISCSGDASIILFHPLPRQFNKNKKIHLKYWPAKNNNSIHCSCRFNNSRAVHQKLPKQVVSSHYRPTVGKSVWQWLGDYNKIQTKIPFTKQTQWTTRLSPNLISRYILPELG